MTIDSYLTEHGISDETIKKFGLLQSHHQSYGDQIVFPVKDIEGNFLFNKYRNLAWSKGGEIPKFNYDVGSSAQLYNLQTIKTSEYAFIFEGEPDVWKASEDGIPAICSTSGANTFEQPWVEILSSKKVLICYDNDNAGQEGIKKILEMIPDALPIPLPEGVKDYCEFRQTHTLQDFQLIVGKIVKENTISYNEFCSVIDKWLLLPDKNVLKVIFASLLSHYFTTDPLWIFLVAPPSGTKTELITLLSALPIVYMMSDLTTKTLFSGLEGKRKESPSLMMRIPNSIITMKDFTTVLSMRSEDKTIILSQLREIYDGKYDKPFGTGGEIHWKGRITLLAGVTGIIDAQQSFLQIMGERFIMYRILQPDDKEVAKKAFSISGHENEMRQDLKSAMRKFFWGIKIPKIADISVPDEIINALASLASFVVIARSGIIRNNYGAKEIELIPEPEAPSRFMKQLSVLIRALAALDKKKEVTWENYYLTLRVALDTIPRNKINHIIALLQTDYSSKTSDIANITGYSISGTELLLEDLVALKLVDKENQGMGITQWKLSDKSFSYLKDILPVADDKLSRYFPEDDFYKPFILKCLFLKPDPV